MNPEFWKKIVRIHDIAVNAYRYFLTTRVNAGILYRYFTPRLGEGGEENGPETGFLKGKNLTTYKYLFK